MPVLSLGFNKLLVERYKQIEPPVKIENNLKITNIKKDSLTLAQKKEPVLLFNFEFSLDYTVKQALLLFTGELLYHAPSKELEKLFNEWEKNKKFDPDIMQEILNTILIRCNIKSLLLAQEIGLPPHIHLPLIEKKPNPNDYIG
ncbi:hypothetical protein HZB88_00950 [archaeon]|nr:hypothetical protein [archaeon]